MADFNGYLKQMSPNLGQDTKKAAPGLFAELGIYSPSEKAQMQMEQNQAMQAQFLLQQQLAAQAQQAQIHSANAKSSVPTGYNFSTFLGMGGMQNLNQADRLAAQAQGMARQVPNAFSQSQPQAPYGASDKAGISPEQIVTQALQQYPNDKPTALRVAGKQLATLGQARNDPYLQNIGANLLNKAVEADKEVADLKAKNAEARKAQISANKEAGPGSAETYRTSNGDITTYRKKYDAEGNYIGDEIKGSGPNKQVTSNDGLTDTQVGANVDKFASLVTNTDATISAMRDIRTNLSKGSAQGWTAAGVGFMNNVKGTLEQLASTGTYSAGAQEALSKFAPTFQEWADKTGVNDSIWNDLVSNLAKTYNPTGTITEKDITRAAKTVGQNVSNPQTVAKILEDAERRSRQFVDKTYKYSTRKVQDLTKEQYDTFLKTFTPGATGGEGDAQDNMDNDSPANREPNWDDAPAGTAAPKNEKEYDALPRGTPYWNPYLRKVVPKK